MDPFHFTEIRPRGAPCFLDQNFVNSFSFGLQSRVNEYKFCLNLSFWGVVNLWFEHVVAQPSSSVQLQARVHHHVSVPHSEVLIQLSRC